jgi:tRNA (mo5U34)-methyltransferase
MTLIREKTFKVAGFSFKIGTEARRVERLKKSLPYRYLVRPAVAALSRDQNGRDSEVAPSARPAPIAGQTTNGAWSRDASEEAARVANIGWYHTIDLGDGIVTPGFIDNRDTVHHFGLPDDLTGKRCLDIGTYDGFWAFEMEKRGASEVIGIDVDSPLDHDMPLPARREALAHLGEHADWKEVWGAQQAQRGLQYPGDGFRLAAEILGSNALRENLNVYDLSPEKVGKFDVVLISQLLLRLRDPQTVIENMFSVTNEGGFALIAEPFDPDLEALERPVSEFLGTSLMGIWWCHSAKSMAKMMETAGFSPVEEVSRFQAANREGAFSKVVLKGYVPVGYYQGEEREIP